MRHECSIHGIGCVITNDELDEKKKQFQAATMKHVQINKSFE